MMIMLCSWWRELWKAVLLKCATQINFNGWNMGLWCCLILSLDVTKCMHRMHISHINSDSSWGIWILTGVQDGRSVGRNSARWSSRADRSTQSSNWAATWSNQDEMAGPVMSDASAEWRGQQPGPLPATTPTSNINVSRTTPVRCVSPPHAEDLCSTWFP